jgi:hypothetical protein
VLSVLNLSDLVILKQWCLDQNLKLAVTPLVDPWYLNIRFADAALRKLVDDDLLSQYGWLDFYNMIGSESRPGASKAVLDMFESYKQVRPHLSLYDLDLYTLLCETVDH